MTKADAILCPFCGAKQRGGRRRCVRCRELFVTDAVGGADGPSTGLSRKRGPLYFISAGASIVILVVSVLAKDAAVPAPVAEASVGTTTGSTPIKAAEVGKKAEPPAKSFVDARREGNMAYHAGNFDAAIAQYQDAIADHPEDAESLNNLGQVLVRTNRAAQAISYFEKAASLNKGKWSYRFNLARALGQVNDWKRAAAEYRVAAQLFPDDYPTQYNLALALHKTGDEQSAVTEFRKAIDLAPEEPTFHLSLAMSLERLNRRTEAADSYERYLQLVPAGPDTDRVRQRVQELKAP